MIANANAQPSRCSGVALPTASRADSSPLDPQRMSLSFIVHPAAVTVADDVAPDREQPSAACREPPLASADISVLCAKKNCYHRASSLVGDFCAFHKPSRLCKVPDCHKCAKTGGYCIAHGGGRRCRTDRCEKSAKEGGFCIAHGGGKRCRGRGCAKSALAGGFCSAHGGGKRCTASYCTKTALKGIAFLRETFSRPQTLPPTCVRVVQDFLYKVEQLRLPSGNARSGFEREYLEICWSIDNAPWYEAALTPQTKFTKAKNRYRDVLPFEKTRVHLLNPENTPAGDYINANFVDSHYIACCAPIPSAICDFWHMVWECDVHVILMLTNFVERERLKADLYWDKHGKCVDFKGVRVQLIGEEDHPASHGFTVRSFKVWRVDSSGAESPSRIIQQLQLTIWPDHGVLQDFRVIAPMLEMVNAYRQEASRALGVDARVVVHCSAGIGRSGTFIAIDIILRDIERAMASSSTSDQGAALLAALNVQQVVHRIRSQRPGMVQTPEQYEMVYRYLAAVLSNQQPW